MTDQKMENINASVRIALEIGTALTIELEGVSIPMQSDFIGMDLQKYLIISSPQPYSMIKHKLFEGNLIIIKYLYKGTIYAFQTKIMEAIVKPDRLLFLEYPKIVQHKDLRTYKRMSCFIPANLRIQGETLRGTLLDINKKGCNCQFQVTAGDKAPSMNVNDTISLQFPFPGIEGMLDIEGKIINLRKNKQQISIGLLFQNPSEETEKVIAEYTLSVEEYM